MDIRFCFKIVPDAMVAVDDETGEGAPAFICVTHEGVKNIPTPERLKELHESTRLGVAGTMGISVDHIECITEEEYDSSVGEDK